MGTETNAPTSTASPLDAILGQPFLQVDDGDGDDGDDGENVETEDDAADSSPLTTSSTSSSSSSWATGSEAPTVTPLAAELEQGETSSSNMSQQGLDETGEHFLIAAGAIG